MSDIYYIKFIARSNPVKVDPPNQSNNTGFLMDWSTLTTWRGCIFMLQLNIFKTNLSKDKVSFAKDFISVHMQTLRSICSRKIWDKKETALVWKFGGFGPIYNKYVTCELVDL